MVDLPSTPSFFIEARSGLEWMLHDLGWNLAYIGFVCWLFFFHSPIRERTRAERSDWYAQLLKIIQVWCLVHVTFFHLMGHYLTKARHRETDPTTVFFPLLTFFLCFFSLFHREKRRWKLGITYGKTTTVLLLNSLVLSFGLTLHFGACGSTEEHIGDFGVLSKIICPQYPKTEPLPILCHLTMIGMFFVCMDYFYKKRHHFHAKRAMLWSDSYSLYNDPTEIGPGGYPPEPQGEPMVEWYSIMAAQTGLKLFFGGALRFLTFDFRSVEDVITPKFFEFARSKKKSLGTNASADDDEESPVREKRGSESAGSERGGGKGSGKKKKGKRGDSPSHKRRLPPQSASAENLSRARTSSPSFQSPGLDSNVSRSPKQSVGPTYPKVEGGSLKRSFSTPSLGTPNTNYEDDDFWFDWVADIGDGFNSTYEIARLLAQPVLGVGTSVSRGFSITQLTRIAKERWRNLAAMKRRFSFGARINELFLGSFSSVDRATGSPTSGPAVGNENQVEEADATDGTIRVDLPRGNFVIIGGDLAYPSPTEEVWQKRFLDVWSDALPKCVPTRDHERRNCPRVTVTDSSKADRATIREACPVSGDEAERGCSAKDQGVLTAPMIFAIPGNHDWFDGIGTYRSKIISKSWIGGWYLPQRTSYFAISLPENWFIFALDNGLFEDIDPNQLLYFLHVTETELRPDSSVILITHEPGWLNDHQHALTGQQHSQQRVQKLAEALGKRLRMRIAGDIHNYSRYSPSQSAAAADREEAKSEDKKGQKSHAGEPPAVRAVPRSKSPTVHSQFQHGLLPTRSDPEDPVEKVDDPVEDYPVLVVSGGGGGFLHGSGVSAAGVSWYGRIFSRRGRYPFGNKVLSLARRIFGFRLVNWKFDIVGGLLYTLIISSLLPLPLHMERSVANVHDMWEFTAITIRSTFVLMEHILQETVTSLIFSVVIIVLSLALVGGKVPAWKRIPLGLFFGLFHVFSAVFLLLVLHHGFELMRINGMILSTATEWRSYLEEEVKATGDDIVQRIEQMVTDNEPFGLGEALAPGLAAVQYLNNTHWFTNSLSFVARGLDATEGFAHLRYQVSHPEGLIGEFAANSTRWQRSTYYGHFLWFYWLLATPTVACLLGCFLWFNVTMLDSGFDAAYSAFRIEDYKNFLRFRLNKRDRTLEIFVIGVDHVPRQWEVDPRHLREKERYERIAKETGQQIPPRHLWEYPSVWRPKSLNLQQKLPWLYHGPKLVDRFVVKPLPQGAEESSPKSAPSP